MKRKICVVTGSRADYGLLYWLMKKIRADKDLTLQTIATGMHLSPEFGLTYRQIEQDGFAINKKVEMLLSSDTPAGISKSMGLAHFGFADAFEELIPDIIVMLGDRFEILPAASCALVSGIPVAHIHGGEITIGAFDDAIRHSITKMSHLHFTSTEEYRQRVIQLGEHPDRVFHVGAPGVENLKRMKLLSRASLEKKIRFLLGERAILVTFHPETMEKVSAKQHFGVLLEALKEAQKLHVIFTKANADPEGRIINRMIDNFVSHNPTRSIAFESMGQLLYLSALKHVDAIVGNSSSGIIEAPSVKTPTIDIGERQKGRVKAASIVSCKPRIAEIKKAINLVFSDSFCKKIWLKKNPYEKENTSELVLSVLKNINLEKIIKKQFFDLEIIN